MKEDQEKAKQTAESSSFSLRVDKMISKIEKQLSDYDTEIGSKLNLVRPDEAGNITISDLEEALTVIQAHPNDERIKKIIKNLDADGDGLVALQEVLKLVEDSSKEGHGEVVADAKSPSGPVLAKSEKSSTNTGPSPNTPAS